MTDRELSEAAAKAAGVYLAPEWRGHHKHLPNWNPLEDDGDALRLAVALRLEVSWWRAAVMVETDDKKASSGICTFGDDPAAATRRAIVRAAAALAGAAPGGA